MAGCADFFNFLLGTIRGTLIMDRTITPTDRINTMLQKVTTPTKDFLILFIGFNFNPNFF